MKEHNWVAQDLDGEIDLYVDKPTIYRSGNWWFKPDTECDVIQRHGARNPNWRESLIDLSKNDYIIKDGILMATRKHAALIHAWADGAEIQFFNTTHNKWDDVTDNAPCWDATTEYRIKPKTRTVTFKLYHINGAIGVWVQGYQGIPGDAELIDKDWREVEIEL